MEIKMTKADLVRKVALNCTLNQAQVNEAIDSLQEVIVDTIHNTDMAVVLPSLGIFRKKVNPARKGRNPLTGETVDIPESHTIAFRPSSSVRRVVGKKKNKK